MSGMNDKHRTDGVESSIDDPMIRGGTVDFSVDDGFAEAVKSGTGRRIDAGTMLFIGVLLASVAGLWSMRFLGRGVASTGDGGDRVAVGKWILDAEKDGAVIGLEDLRVLERLDKDRLNDLQVPTDDLKTDEPFRYWGEIDLAAVEMASVDHRPLNTIDQIKDAFDETIDEIGALMNVSAILAPDSPRAQAVLNGHRIMVGDVFDVPHEGDEYGFEVERIGIDGVVFVSRLSEPRHARRIEVGVKRNF
ncbi:MAG: hypothetical protein CMJ52_07085 [Planctomycetaceae bacterium]|nr:hypothetical protein [Planctomycetaceae bacterium]